MDNKVFSERLKQARQAKGLSQAKLAEVVGVGQNAISNYEKAGNKGSMPKLETAAEMAKALDVSLDWLVGTTDKQKNEAAAKMDGRSFLDYLITLLQEKILEFDISDTTFGNPGMIIDAVGDEAAQLGIELKNFFEAETVLKKGNISDSMIKLANDGWRNNILDKYRTLFEKPEFPWDEF